MEFIYKLIPIDGLFNFGETTLTAYWVLATILIFIYSSYRLFKVINSTQKDLESLNLDFDVDRIQNKSLKNEVTNYISNLVEFEGERKSKTKANEFINFNKLIENENNYRLLHSIPNVLVGFGILGTFVGLAFGIADFRTDNTEEIQLSIKNLLAGMSTAFISSIWGMSLSLLYSYLEKNKSNGLLRELEHFCIGLDQRYLFSENEYKNYEFKKSQELLNKYLTTKDNNENQVFISNIIRDLFLENQKQSAALQSFATDLATKIEAGFETILSNQFDNNLSPVLKEISDNIKTLLTNIKNPVSDLTENLISDLKNSMKEILEGFQKSISQSTTDNLEYLSRVLADTVQGIKDLPNSLTLEIDKIKKVVETLNSTTISTADKLNGMIETINSNNQVQSTITSDLVKKLNETIEKVNETTNNIIQIHESFSNTLQKFDSFSNTFKLSADNLLSNINALIDSISKHNSSLVESYSKNENIIVKTTELINNFSEQYEIINSNLRSIFKEINDGLIEYSETVRNNIRDILNVFSEEITKANEGLANNASKIEDILAELNDNFEKYFNRNNT